MYALVPGTRCSDAPVSARANPIRSLQATALLEIHQPNQSFGLSTLGVWTWCVVAGFMHVVHLHIFAQKLARFGDKFEEACINIQGSGRN